MSRKVLLSVALAFAVSAWPPMGRGEEAKDLRPAWERAWRTALPGYVHRFPRDHGAHREFRTEWWYYSGHLAGPAGREFSFMLAFFRSGVRPPGLDVKRRRSRWALRDLYFAHFALLEVRTKRHLAFERFSRGALEEAGASESGLRVWLRTWRAKGRMEGGSFVQEIFAEEEGVQLRLRLVPRKNPVFHGREGVSQKAAGEGRASHYYSFTRLVARGDLVFQGKQIPVRGSAWMDHEFGSNQLTPDQVGWDWLGLQLSDGRELMLYLMRKASGGVDPNSSGTLVQADGRAIHLPLEAFRFEGTGNWRSPSSGAVYPMGWRVRVPGGGIVLVLRPLAEEQEMRTSGSTRVIYWEGAVSAEGTSGGQPVRARGFVEMTGYAKGGRPRF